MSNISQTYGPYKVRDLGETSGTSRFHSGLLDCPLEASKIASWMRCSHFTVDCKQVPEFQFWECASYYARGSNPPPVSCRFTAFPARCDIKSRWRPSSVVRYNGLANPKVLHNGT